MKRTFRNTSLKPTLTISFNKFSFHTLPYRLPIETPEIKYTTELQKIIYFVSSSGNHEYYVLIGFLYTNSFV